MSIDEKRLDELEQKLKYSAIVTHEPFQTTDPVELIRLARLGLWAEKNGIPPLRRHVVGCENPLCTCKEAFAALPKDIG